MSWKAAVGTLTFVAVVVVILALAVHGLYGLGSIRGESSYTGTVVDVVEDKGVVYRPSWVNMKTDPRSSDIQSYCIHPNNEESMLPKLYDAMERGKRVTVTYSRPLWVSPTECRSSDAILHSVRFVNGTNTTSA